MHRLNSLLTSLTSLIFLNATIAPSLAQSNNQSDITGPNPIEMIPSRNRDQNQGAQTNGNDGGTAPTISSRIDRAAFNQQLQSVSPSVAMQMVEQLQAQELADLLGIELDGEVPTPEQIAATLNGAWQETGQKGGFLQVVITDIGVQFQFIAPGSDPSNPDSNASNSSNTDNKDELISLKSYSKQTSDKEGEPNLITEPIEGTNATISKVTENIDQEKLLRIVQRFTTNILRQRNDYMTLSRGLYDVLIRPIEGQLEASDIDVLIISMDQGLRGLPIGALHDGDRFVIEKYAVGLVPSFGLADAGYTDIKSGSILGMGAEKFDGANDLPGVGVELTNIVQQPWNGEVFLNDQFTFNEFIDRNKNGDYEIIHLATHGEFRPGKINESYIQFSDRRLTIPEFQKMANDLGWIYNEDPPIELLVLSACKTAVGDKEAELGFAGLAVASGVKSAMASLWYISDKGTLALMTEFYHQLQLQPIKSQALRAAQLALLKGKVYYEGDILHLSNGQTVPIGEAIAKQPSVDLTHPFFWSAFVMIGNWN